MQRPLEGGVIGAGRLEGDARDLRSDPADQRRVPGGVVGDAAGLAARPAAGVEMVFRDVDADGRLAHLFRCPMLVMRASRSGFRSGLGKDEGRSYSPPAPSGLQSCDPSPRRRRRAAIPPAASPSWTSITPRATDKQSARATARAKQTTAARAPARSIWRQRPPRGASRAEATSAPRWAQGCCIVLPMCSYVRSVQTVTYVSGLDTALDRVPGVV